MTEKELIKLLKNPVLNKKRDHYVADCPFCDKERHFYLNRHKIFNKFNSRYRSAWDCKKCGETGNVIKLLKEFGKLDLLKEGKFIDLNKKLNVSLRKNVEKEEMSLEVKIAKLPIGFKRLKDHWYWRERGFTKKEFEKYKIGITKIELFFKNYTIIAIEENNQIKGYLARSVLSKKEIDGINKKRKEEGIGAKYLRYQNSFKTDFSKLLFGYDEIQYMTETVILVEGFTDKIRVDQALGLDHDLSIKCCATFGKDISRIQIEKLRLKNVKNVILVQDNDALKVSKKNIEQLKEYFNTQAGFMKNEKDLGDSTDQEIFKVFNDLKNPIGFKQIVNSKILL